MTKLSLLLLVPLCITKVIYNYLIEWDSFEGKKVKPTKSHKELEFFKYEYEKHSGLKLSINYLTSCDVYVFKRKNKIVGGFCINTNHPLRTLEVFSRESNYYTLITMLSEFSIKEVTCFWICSEYRRKWFSNIYYWHLMTFEAARNNCDYVIYGTNIEGLARIYDVPSKAILLHSDIVSNKNTYIYLAKPKNIVLGLQQQMFSRLNRIMGNRFPKSISLFQKSSINGLSK